MVPVIAARTTSKAVPHTKHSSHTIDVAIAFNSAVFLLVKLKCQINNRVREAFLLSCSKTVEPLNRDAVKRCIAHRFDVTKCKLSREKRANAIAFFIFDCANAHKLKGCYFSSISSSLVSISAFLLLRDFRRKFIERFLLEATRRRSTRLSPPSLRWRLSLSTKKNRAKDGSENFCARF